MSQMFISQGSSLGIRYHEGTPMEAEERFPTGPENSKSCGLWHQLRGEPVALRNPVAATLAKSWAKQGKRGFRSH